MFPSKPFVIYFLLAIAIITLATPGLLFESLFPSKEEWFWFEGYTIGDVENNVHYAETPDICAYITKDNHKLAFTWDKETKQCLPFEVIEDPDVIIRWPNPFWPSTNLKITKGFVIPGAPPDGYLVETDMKEYIVEITDPNYECTFLYEKDYLYACARLVPNGNRYVMVRRQNVDTTLTDPLQDYI